MRLERKPEKYYKGDGIQNMVKCPQTSLKEQGGKLEGSACDLRYFCIAVCMTAAVLLVFAAVHLHQYRRKAAENLAVVILRLTISVSFVT